MSETTIKLAVENAEPPYRARDFDVLLAMDIPEREMLLAPVVQAKSIGMIFSRRGVGKTHVGIGIAYAVASGGTFLRWTAPKPRRVLLVDGEMPLVTLQERIAATVAGSMVHPPSGEYLRILAADDQRDGLPDLSTPEGVATLEPFLDGVELVILDNLSTLCRSGQENESESWSPVQKWALAMRRRGISVLFIHHAGKGGAQRGTSKREDVLDTILLLQHPADYSPTEGARFEVHFDKSRGVAGDAVRPFEAKLEVRDGASIWTMRDLEDVELSRAAGLFSDGYSVRDVAKEMDISVSAAGRWRKKAIERGLFTPTAAGANGAAYD